MTTSKSKAIAQAIVIQVLSVSWYESKLTFYFSQKVIQHFNRHAKRRHVHYFLYVLNQNDEKSEKSIDNNIGDNNDEFDPCRCEFYL